MLTYGKITCKLPTLTARLGLADIFDTSNDTNYRKYVIIFEVNLNTSVISKVVLRPVLVLWEHQHRPPTPQLKSPIGFKRDSLYIVGQLFLQ